jgi:protein required for attachment to host cells
MARNQQPNYWVLLADGHHARLLEGGRPFDALTGVDGGVIEPSSGAHAYSHDIMSDRPGRSFNSADSRRSAIEPQTDPQRLEKTRFAQKLAAILDAGATADRFERLIIAAPAGVLGDLRHSMGSAARDKVVAEIDKDLVKTPSTDLGKHLLNALGF